MDPPGGVVDSSGGPASLAPVVEVGPQVLEAFHQVCMAHVKELRQRCRPRRVRDYGDVVGVYDVGVANECRFERGWSASRIRMSVLLRSRRPDTYSSDSLELNVKTVCPILEIAKQLATHSIVPYPRSVISNGRSPGFRGFRPKSTYLAAALVISSSSFFSE